MLKLIFGPFKYAYVKTLAPIYRASYDKLIKPIFSLKGSPHSIALGLAIGLWWALTPTVGIQMTVSFIFCTVARANVPIALAMCWVSNPVTFIPMYYGYYWLGLILLNTPATPWEEFKEQIKNDYCFVAMSPADPVLVNTDLDPVTSFQKMAQQNMKFYYSKQQPNSLYNIKKLAEKAGVQLSEDQLYSIEGDFIGVLGAIENNGGIGIIDYSTYNKILKEHIKYRAPNTSPVVAPAKKHLVIVTKIRHEYGFLGFVRSYYLR